MTCKLIYERDGFAIEMCKACGEGGAMNSSGLRKQIQALNAKYASATGIPHYTSSDGVVLYPNRGNLHHDSLRAIQSNPTWAQRLQKSHRQRAGLPAAHRQTALELDSSNSSDALLMSVFCHPDTPKCRRLARLLGLTTGTGLTSIEFDLRAKVKLVSRYDST